MNYPAAEFQTRRDLILNSVGQYLFLSSARVYAQSETPLTEDSPRLLDVTTDAAYLKTTEYALEKARSENFLRDARQSTPLSTLGKRLHPKFFVRLGESIMRLLSPLL